MDERRVPEGLPANIGRMQPGHKPIQRKTPFTVRLTLEQENFLLARYTWVQGGLLALVVDAMRQAEQGGAAPGPVEDVPPAKGKSRSRGTKGKGA